jgi:ribosomal protein L11 methyltransferase
MSSIADTCWLWSKISSVAWEDAWEERLRFLPPGACAILSRPGSRALRIRAYVDARTGKKLLSYFGGSLRKLSAKDWNRELERERRPLHVRDRLVVFSEEAPWKRHRESASPRPSLFIPPSMAFGTGSHPTTAGCLRLLSDITRNLTPKTWHQADLGTGSGILALAGRVFGAGDVEAIDYDPVCLRELRRNARINRIPLKLASVCDVHKWRPLQPCQVITANLFSDTLISASQVLVDALEPGGCIIFSGVLRAQLQEVLRAFTTKGLKVAKFNHQGKWVFGLLNKPEIA